MSIGHVALDRCVFMPKRTLPKTPSGKLQRHLCQLLVADGLVEPLGIVDFQPAGCRQG